MWVYGFLLWILFQGCSGAPIRLQRPCRNNHRRVWEGDAEIAEVPGSAQHADLLLALNFSAEPVCGHAQTEVVFTQSTVRRLKIIWTNTN